MKEHIICHNNQCKICNCGLCCTKINNVGVVRGGHEILRNVNLHVHCGELTAIIGTNGSGKSTLFKALLGEIPHTGELQFLDAQNHVQRRPMIGYVPQKLDFDLSSPVSVLDLFAAALTKTPVWFHHFTKIRQQVSESLAVVEAEHLLHRRLGALSGGEMQRVLLALALNPVPHLLLLDEPVSGIDQKGLTMFYQTVSSLRQKYDLSIILVSHDFNLVKRYADRVAFLNNKTIECCGTPGDVFNHPLFLDTFGLKGNHLIQIGEGGRDI